MWAPAEMVALDGVDRRRISDLLVENLKKTETCTAR
jgi:hypothetical protein